MATLLPLQVILIFVLTSHVIAKEQSSEKDEEDLISALRQSLNTEIARNVVIFIGDGMGPNTATAARIYMAGEEGHLVWEKFPHLATLKTYSADKQVPDSASTATAMFTGVKNNFEMVGLDEDVLLNDCEGSLKPEHHLLTLATLAQDAGKGTGVVTTTRLTDATPAALYARSAHRDWECDSALQGRPCKDIARQLIEDLPGKYFNVMLGGGEQVLRAEVGSSLENPVDGSACVRTDGRDLVEEWIQAKVDKQLHHAFVRDTGELLAVDTSHTDYLLGIFSNSHLPYEYSRDTSERGVPSLTQMTVTALKLLTKYPSGFLLMVEGGLIDKGHHAGKARVALHEVLSLNDAVNATLDLLEAMGIKEETLVIVTSDHSHTLTMSGYPSKGNNIFGIADTSLIDGVPYTTLSYATSGIENFHFAVDGGKVIREDPSKIDTTSFDYHTLAPVVTDMNTHGGSDVFVYATGPQAHLFHNLHENTYIATVIKYATKLGKFAGPSAKFSSASALFSPVNPLNFLVLVFFFFK